MKKILFSVFALFFLLAIVGGTFAQTEQLTLKPSGKGEWKLVAPGGQIIGTLRAMEDGAYSIQRPDGEYAGVILKNGMFQKPGRRPMISADEAHLFLDTLDAMKKMK